MKMKSLLAVFLASVVITRPVAVSRVVTAALLDEEDTTDWDDKKQAKPEIMDANIGIRG